MSGFLLPWSPEVFDAAMAQRRHEEVIDRRILTRQHDYGKHVAKPLLDCEPCSDRCLVAALTVLSSLTDYYAPRPAGWVPRGFRR